MKINKIAGICKRAGMIRLYDEPDGSDAALAVAVNNEIHRLNGIPDTDPETGEVIADE